VVIVAEIDILVRGTAQAGMRKQPVHGMWEKTCQPPKHADPGRVTAINPNSPVHIPTG